MKELQDLIDLIDNSIKEDSSNLITGGNIIKDGYNQEIDELRIFIKNSHNWLNEYTKSLINSTGINGLKIKFTNSLGYFIEISNSNKIQIPDNFILKGTLLNSLRYTTKELSEFDEKISSAETDLNQLEYQVFSELNSEINTYYNDIKNCSEKISNIDFLSTLSIVANDNNYIKPEIHSGYDLKIENGRHPVIEKIEKTFISNDLNINSNNFVNIITGPNMGGKSTYLRQNALIIFMSHIGSFIPASYAKIPLTDKIFSRIGANDNLFLGSSTFMVEMQEVANILNNSTKKSFVIIDEVGRGTSTYDGMSLAWAILKQNHDNIKAKTLFATHYHELVDESKKLKGVSNFSVAVGENDDNLVFLRKIIPGSIKKSYGIEVAKLAGLPKLVITEANNFLKNYEKINNFNQMSLGNIGIEEKIVYKEIYSKIEEKIKKIDLNNLTPFEALNLLNELKKEIK
ncbi:MAG: DNA mismatch repair protein MutS [Candidatus Gracilibacteria bacterium]|nr:DNA mismatch repair protein MutS [Candidatus Gracilibacteria bacterium]